MVGALAGFAAEEVAHVTSRALAVASALASVVVLTGAIHLDGFLDGCDAFFASASAERRLEILKDPRHGTFAVAGLAVALALWLAALWSLAPGRYPLALALTGASARWSAVIHARYVPYGRAGTVTRAFERPPPPGVLALGLGLIAALAWPLGARGAAAFGLTLALAALCVRWIRGRLGGGLVGDAYGFTIVVTEVAALVALAF